MCVCVLSHVRLFCNPVDYSPPASSVHRVSRQESWSGLPFPPPGDLPDSGIEPASPALQADSLPLNHLGSPQRVNRWAKIIIKVYTDLV